VTEVLPLPHSEDVEAALVARLLVDPAQLPVIAAKLEPADFYTPGWRKAYAGMQLLSNERRAVDIVSLQTLIGPIANELGEKVGGLTSAYRAPVEEYAELIRGFAFRRRLIGSLDSVITKARVLDSREELLAQLHDAVTSITAGVGNDNLMTPNQAVDIWRRELEERLSGRKPGLSWGLQALDGNLLPATGGEMVVIAARPSVGKTALAEGIADAWARQTVFPVLFVSLEMSIKSLIDRQVSRDSGVHAEDVVRGVLKDADERAVLEASEGRRQVGVWYLDDPWATTTAIRAAAAKVRVLAGGLAGIVVDYIQIVKDPGDQEVQRVTKISRQIKAIAREFDVPLVALSQLSRASENREDKHPRLSDLRESGAIEQDADVVIGIHRPLTDPHTDIDVLKARQGRAGVRTQLWFDKPHVRFLDVEAGTALEEEEAIEEALEGNAAFVASEKLPY
jgi:replicative DNA helicase